MGSPTSLLWPSQYVGPGPSVTRTANLEEEAEILLFDISGFVNVDNQLKTKTKTKTNKKKKLQASSGLYIIHL